jgi:predicted site-specific integrase-resolvase
MLGVAIITLRRWHAAGTLVPAGRTPGGPRRYDPAQVRTCLGVELGSPRVLALARLTLPDQQ